MYRLASNCKVIKGYSNSIIIDLQHQKIYRYNNKLMNLLFKQVNNKFSDSELGKIFGQLIRNDIFIKIDLEDSRNFPGLSLKYDYPAVINNSIIEIDKIKYEVLHLIFDQLNHLLCKHIELRFINKIDTNKIFGILELLNSTTIQTVDLHICYSSHLQTYELINLKKNLRIHWIIVHSVPETKMNLSHVNGVVYTIERLNSNSCGVISPFYFSHHINHYTESQNFNTCLNRKICINSKGEIKNCLNLNEVFGNIKDTSLEDVAKNPGFTKLWHIRKDNIETCSECEFRYLCTDCRAFIKDINNLHSQPSKCYYNPYIGKWSDEPDYIDVDEWKSRTKISDILK